MSKTTSLMKSVAFAAWGLLCIYLYESATDHTKMLFWGVSGAGVLVIILAASWASRDFSFLRNVLLILVSIGALVGTLIFLR